MIIQVIIQSNNYNANKILQIFNGMKLIIILEVKIYL